MYLGLCIVFTAGTTMPRIYYYCVFVVAGMAPIILIAYSVIKIRRTVREQ